MRGGRRCAASPRTRRSSRRRSSARPTTTSRSPSWRREGLDAREIYDAIAVTDVQLACDVLRPVWDERRAAPTASCRSRSSPASRTTPRATLDAGARVLGARRPPEPDDQDPGTDEGMPGDRGGASPTGINVNVTLLFSVESYDARSPRPTSAAWSAASRRASRSTRTRSPASSSRASTPRSTSASRGAGRRGPARARAAVANARAAYQRFKELFEGERFAALRDAGCPVQRPLWASTGVKNPRTPRRKYVDALVARTPSTRCRCRRCTAAPSSSRSTRRHGRPGPDAPTSSRAARTPASTWTT